MTNRPEIIEEQYLHVLRTNSVVAHTLAYGGSLKEVIVNLDKAYNHLLGEITRRPISHITKVSFDKSCLEVEVPKERVGENSDGWNDCRKQTITLLTMAGIKVKNVKRTTENKELK